MAHFGRRSFLLLAATAGGGLVLARSAGSRFGGGGALSSAGRPRPLSTTTTAPRLVSLTTASPPARLRSVDGRLDVELVARRSRVGIPGGPDTALTYNGLLPGPLLELDPGDTLRLLLRNGLDRPTNLHYHGLHIPPTGIADNVFLSVPPGGTQRYEFRLPTDHPPGLYYYHPHRHGTVADQVFGGLGGPLIVRGALDRIPEVRAATEHVLFLKDLPSTDDVPPLGGGPGWGMGMGVMLGREGPVLTVNGQLRPEIPMPASGLLRLRILNGSNARFYRLALEGHSFHLIATDTGPLEAPVEVEEVLLAPGERVDILVRASGRSGRFRLLNLPYDRGSGAGMGMGPGALGMGMGRHRMGWPGGMGPPDGAGDGWEPDGMGPRGGGGEGERWGGHWRGGRPGGSAERWNPGEPIPLATVVSLGEERPPSLPSTLVPMAVLGDPLRTRRFVLDHGMAPGQGMVFLINGRAYDHQRIDTRVRLGDTEDWELVNAGVMDHPFHLHVHPFHVLSRDGRPEPFRAWKDTVLVRAGETVRIRVAFRDHPGPTVYHCHILDHEELGMMGILEVEA